MTKQPLTTPQFIDILRGTLDAVEHYQRTCARNLAVEALEVYLREAIAQLDSRPRPSL